MRSALIEKLTSLHTVFVNEKYTFSLLGLSLALPFFLFGCGLQNQEDNRTTFEYDFRESRHDWETFFTGYYVGREDKMKLTSDYRTLPEPLETVSKGLYISGMNTSDDLKMLFRKKIEGLKPNTTYRVRTTIRFATEEPAGCAGIGGAPGEAVKVISAAGNRKPEAVFKEEDDYYRLNLQYQGEPQTWYQNRIMGHIANSRECEQGDRFELKELGSETTQELIRTNEDGEAWLLFGTRSGVEGQTQLYYTYFKADFIK